MRNNTELKQLNFGLDDAFAFACRLRGAISRINDPGWRDEPADAPWPIKVYQGGDRVPLAGALPWWVPTTQVCDPMLRLGGLLFHAAGITRARWHPSGVVLSSPQHPEWVWPERTLSGRRAVPSGGNMYPTEIYVTALDWHLRRTAFHYDPARHELTDLAHPCVGKALRSALGFSRDAPLAPLALILTHRFCANVHKYGNFAYRLGAADVGVVLGRLVACGAEAFEEVQVLVDFNDAELNAICGIDGREESAYAVVLLGTARPPEASALDSTSALPSPSAVFEPGNPAKPSAAFAAMHEAACRLPISMGQVGVEDPPNQQGPSLGRTARGKGIALPPALVGIRAQRRDLLCRTSNGRWFTGAPLGADVLATILGCTHEAMEALGAAFRDGQPPALELYCAVDRVEQVPPAWYCYDPDTHSLSAVGPECTRSPATDLQRTLHAATVDVERGAFSVHIATIVDFRSDARGARAYRVQQLFVGAAMEALTRWSTAMGVGSHPLLGFDASAVDQFYGLAEGPFGVQAQVSIGAARPAGMLEGSVIA